MVKTESHIYGIYPKTNELRIRVNRWERGRLTTEEIGEILRKEKGIYYELLKEAGISTFTDPLFNWYDILRPVALLSGAELGPLTRYKETNTFYRLPEFSEIKSISGNPGKFGELSENPPLPLYQAYDQPGFSAFLPSPVTFYRMSQVSEAISREEFTRKISENYLSLCKNLGIKSVTLFEGFEYNGTDLTFLNSLTEDLKVYLITEGEIRDDHFKGLSKKPYSIVAEDIDNAEVAARNSEVPGIKLIDAHNTKLEEGKALKQRVGEISSKVGSDKLVISNSDYLDFLPRSIADKKVKILSEAGE